MFLRGGRSLPSSWRALLVIPAWLATMAWMWSWWLNPARIDFWPLFIPLTLALLYEFALLPSAFLYFVLKAKKPARRIAPKNLKVAVITPCVPAKESLEVVERQLQAMTAITYPHDSWVLDEGGSKELKRLARRYGVKYFSRKGVRKYNQSGPPFQKKTKAGNVNAWIEHVKRRKYDFFVQLDIDHIPKPNYLNKTLGHFRDPEVAWVQAPSVYSNFEHWTARGAAEQELVLQGPLQMGFYGHSNTPFIIGSHTTYRMSAIREIGGYQPTRAEDHLDTVALSNRGYRGVFLPEIIAEGDGPETLNTYLAQQFAWAYSMFQVLIYHSPKLLKGMGWKQRILFLFAQTWYPLWSLAYFVMFATPLAALLLNRNPARVADAEEFFIHFVPLFAGSFLTWWAGRHLMQPQGLGLTWRGMLLHVVRWPVVLRAIIAVIGKIKKPYMITPKGKHAHVLPTVATYRPFLLLCLASALSVLGATFLMDRTPVVAQMIFALTNAMFMLSVCLIDLSTRYRQAVGKLTNFRRYWLQPTAAVATVLVFTAVAFTTSPLGAIEQLRYQPAAIRLAKTASPAIIEKPIWQMSTKEAVAALNAEPSKDGAAPKWGIYSPKKQLESDEPYLRHIFISWNDTRYLAQELLRIQREGNTALVTIEPRIRAGGSGAKLLDDIRDGRHDRRLKKLADIFEASNQPIYIRFAHEMELANLYPWGAQDPALFKAAYRHTFRKLDRHNPKYLKWVWSPAGNHGAEAYYPGRQYVDVVGTTVLHDRHWYGDQPVTFGQISENRRWLEMFDKPLWVVEFGAGKHNRAAQKALLKDAKSQYRQQGFDAVLYIDIPDVNIKGPNYSLSDPEDFGDLFAKTKTKKP